jgi:hypothetical protein
VRSVAVVLPSGTPFKEGAGEALKAKQGVAQTRLETGRVKHGKSAGAVRTGPSKTEIREFPMPEIAGDARS